MVTERDMLNLLLDRYTTRRPGTITDRWVRAEHVRLTLGELQKGVTRIADFVAIDKYPQTLALHGHEVKVARSDWLHELARPEKSAGFRRHMHHWWIVAPSFDVVRSHELPEGWGLMIPGRNGLRVRVQSPLREPEPLPTELAVSIAAAATRTAHREPLHRDAEAVWIDRMSHLVCMACGSKAPCGLHQPRAIAAAEAHP